MFRALVEQIRTEAVKKDITNIRPYLVKKGREAAAGIQHSGQYSRSKLRKWGIIPNPYKKRKS